MSPVVAVVSERQDVRAAAARILSGAPADWDVTLHEHEPERADVVVRGPDSPGDGVPFNPGDTDLLERIRSRLGGDVIGITGAPGTGVTSVALHLAAAMARAGRAARYIDAQPSGGALERLGLPDLPEGPSRQPLPYGFDAVFRHPPDAPVTACGGGPAVVDAAPDAPVLEGCRWVLLVLPPTRPAARRAVCVLDAHPGWYVVTNRTGPGGETTRRKIEQTTGRPVLIELPCCPALRDAEDGGGLVSGWSRWARGIDRLARALVR